MATNPKTRRALTGAVVLLAVVCAILLPIYREPTPAARIGPSRPAVTNSLAIDPRQSAREDADPSAVASLFGFAGSAAGVVEAREARREANPEAQPPSLSPAPLRYVGWTNLSGARSFLFVDAETGRVFELSTGRPNEGWTLLEETAQGFVLANGSERLAATRR